MTPQVLRNAMAFGTAIASFNVEQFGTEGVESLRAADVRSRVGDLYRFALFEPIDVELRD